MHLICAFMEETKNLANTSHLHHPSPSIHVFGLLILISQFFMIVFSYIRSAWYTISQGQLLYAQPLHVLSFYWIVRILTRFLSIILKVSECFQIEQNKHRIATNLSSFVITMNLFSTYCQEKCREY